MLVDLLWLRADRQALAAGGHRPGELVEQDLEGAEPLVQEVLRLVLQPGRVGLRDALRRQKLGLVGSSV